MQNTKRLVSVMTGTECDQVDRCGQKGDRSVILGGKEKVRHSGKKWSMRGKMKVTAALLLSHQGSPLH